MRNRWAIVFSIVVCGLLADLHAQLRARVHASGLTTPVAFVQDPTDRAVQFVVQQNGHIRVIRDGVVLPADFLDLSRDTLAGGERGLLGLAFAPDPSSGRFFVNFTNGSGDTVVARFRRSAGSVVADPASRFDFRWGGAGGPASIAQPFSNQRMTARSTTFSSSRMLPGQNDPRADATPVAGIPRERDEKRQRCATHHRDDRRFA